MTCAIKNINDLCHLVDQLFDNAEAGVSTELGCGEYALKQVTIDLIRKGAKLDPPAEFIDEDSNNDSK